MYALQNGAMLFLADFSLAESIDLIGQFSKSSGGARERRTLLIEAIKVAEVVVE
jgi:hypothetical protein